MVGSSSLADGRRSHSRCQMGSSCGGRARSSDDRSRHPSGGRHAHCTGVLRFVFRRVRWAPALVAIASLIPAWRVAIDPGPAWGQPPLAALHENIPRPVAHGLAHLRGARSRSASVSLNVDLATREPAQLEELIRDASTPGSRSYGHYLTPEQYDARFAPTAGEVRAVESWLRGLG